MRSFSFLAALLATTLCLRAGEPELTTIYQPLDRLGAGGIKVVPVTCNNWHGSSGLISLSGLISAKNVPPTNNPRQATEDLNVASICGVNFLADAGGADGKGRQLVLDAMKFDVPERCGHPQEEILRASLECLRRILPPEMHAHPLVLNAADKDAAWMTRIVNEFNAHDRTKVFFPAEE